MTWILRDSTCVREKLFRQRKKVSEKKKNNTPTVRAHILNICDFIIPCHMVGHVGETGLVHTILIPFASLSLLLLNAQF